MTLLTDRGFNLSGIKVGASSNDGFAKDFDFSGNEKGFPVINIQEEMGTIKTHREGQISGENIKKNGSIINAKMGAPVDNRANQFSNIKMRDDGNNADRLNRLASNDMVDGGIKYVDAKTHNKMGKDEFLKLLTVQLNNQDPLKPVDQKKFAADLAQFSQLEQMANMNTKLESIQANKNAESKFYGASFLGKIVRTKGTTIEHDGSGSPVMCLLLFQKMHQKSW